MSLRVGLAGVGMMGRHHARILRELDGVELVAAADPAGDRHRVLHSGIPVVAGVEELIGFGLDYCVVATPTSTHLETGLRLAAAGIATLMEKPLAARREDAQLLAHAFATEGVLGAVGQVERYNPAVQAMAGHLTAGAIGKLYQVTTSRQGPYPGRIGDVGVVLDLATHDIDIVTAVTGQRITSVTAHTSRRSGQPHEDLLTAICLLDDGTISSHLVNWLSPFKQRLTTALGERGCLQADTLHADLTFYANGSAATDWPAAEVFRGVSEGDTIRYAIRKKEPLAAEHEAFRDALLGEPASVVRFADALDTIAVAEAILASADASGAVVKVGYTVSDRPSSR